VTSIEKTVTGRAFGILDTINNQLWMDGN